MPKLGWSQGMELEVLKGPTAEPLVKEVTETGAFRSVPAVFLSECTLLSPEICLFSNSCSVCPRGTYSSDLNNFSGSSGLVLAKHVPLYASRGCATDDHQLLRVRLLQIASQTSRSSYCSYSLEQSIHLFR